MRPAPPAHWTRSPACCCWNTASLPPARRWTTSIPISPARRCWRRTASNASMPCSAAATASAAVAPRCCFAASTGPPRDRVPPRRVACVGTRAGQHRRLAGLGAIAAQGAGRCAGATVLRLPARTAAPPPQPAGADDAGNGVAAVRRRRTTALRVRLAPWRNVADAGLAFRRRRPAAAVAHPLRLVGAQRDRGPVVDPARPARRIGGDRGRGRHLRARRAGRRAATGRRRAVRTGGGGRGTAAARLRAVDRGRAVLLCCGAATGARVRLGGYASQLRLAVAAEPIDG